jgi:glycosyltransferase involved in cell wall biosynthesis
MTKAVRSEPLKLLVFAHTPPPYHGQSYMVQLMLDGFGGDHRKPDKNSELRTQNSKLPSQHSTPDTRHSFGIECYHVNARLSNKLEDIGELRLGKLFLLFGYCAQAIWCRFRYRVHNLYYIPAPGKRSALYRDWVVMLICRPFFKRIVLHWHAAGLAKWLETAVQMRSRAITFRLMKHADLSLILSYYNRADAEKLVSRQIRIISNGIADPCPQFTSQVLPRRLARFSERQKLLSARTAAPTASAQTAAGPQTLSILYLAHCTREKGLFDTVAGVWLANRQLLARRSPVTLRLLVAGTFVTDEEHDEFNRILAQPGAAQTIEYLGFVSGDQKNRLFREADLFCFPTYYQNENQPVNLIEAMAFGLPILTTRWRSIPELFPSNYPGLVNIRSPEQVADRLLVVLASESGEAFREVFLRHFTLERHLSSLAEAFVQLEETGPVPRPAPAMGAVTG